MSVGSSWRALTRPNKHGAQQHPHKAIQKESSGQSTRLMVVAGQVRRVQQQADSLSSSDVKQLNNESVHWFSIPAAILDSSCVRGVLSRGELRLQLSCSRCGRLCLLLQPKADDGCQ